MVNTRDKEPVSFSINYEDGSKDVFTTGIVGVIMQPTDKEDGTVMVSPINCTYSDYEVMTDAIVAAKEEISEIVELKEKAQLLKTLEKLRQVVSEVKEDLKKEKESISEETSNKGKSLEDALVEILKNIL